MWVAACGLDASSQPRKPCMMAEPLKGLGPNSLDIIWFGIGSSGMKWPFHATLLNKACWALLHPEFAK